MSIRHNRGQPGKTAIDIIAAMSDPNLFGQHFRNADDWVAWKVFLHSLFGLPLDEKQLALFRQCTGRKDPPVGGTNEAWLVVGRRGGKSFILATLAVFLACFRDWRQYLGPGERGTIMIIAADRKQARVIMRYVGGLLASAPMLRELIIHQTRERIDLERKVTIEVHSASLRTTRGYSIVAALLDELAFWPTSEFAAEPDREVLAALRPGMSNVPGSMLLCASSPYARKGALWDAYRRHYGKDSPVLVWQAPTRTMNQRIPQRIIDEAMDADPASATAEYLAQFRSDVESFVLREAVEACITPNVLERFPQSEANYVGFVDPSGGSADEMTLAIAHNDRARQTIVIDAVRWFKPPFSPEVVVGEFAQVLKTYRITKIIGDRYAGEWPREQFAKFGIRYEPSAKPKSELYVDLLPLINSTRIELLDHARANAQLLALERRTSRAGRDSIDHPAGAHDDLINAIAGAAVFAAQKYGSFDVSMAWVSGPDGNDAEEQARQWRVAQFMAHIARYG